MNSDKLTIAFSTCPNDTFMFDALVNRRLKGKGPGFEIAMADIEELNRAVLEGEPDVSKVSYAIYPSISENYQLLDSGSALGYSNGPLIISKKKIYPDELDDAEIAIPGFHTTANFLLTVLFSGVKNKKEYLFSDIEEAVLSNECDAGLIIHETRFTYREKGLSLVADLGTEWESKFKLPVPLGGIVVRRSLPEELKLAIQEKIRESIRYGFAEPAESMPFIKEHARELSEEVIGKHIKLYVNEFSVQLGEKGRNAIKIFFQKGTEAGLFKPFEGSIFIDE